MSASIEFLPVLGGDRIMVRFGEPGAMAEGMLTRGDAKHLRRNLDRCLKLGLAPGRRAGLSKLDRARAADLRQLAAKIRQLDDANPERVAWLLTERANRIEKGRR